jgi:hypothetical protein
VEECNQVPPGSEARSLVYQLQTLRLQPGQGLREVRDPIGDVMKAGAPALKKTAHGSVGAQRLDEFHGAYEEDADSLSREFLYRGRGISGDELEEEASLLQGRHGHRHVVQRVGEHVYFGALVRAIGAHEDA